MKIGFIILILVFQIKTFGQIHNELDSLLENGYEKFKAEEIEKTENIFNQIIQEDVQFYRAYNGLAL